MFTSLGLLDFLAARIAALSAIDEIDHVSVKIAWTPIKCGCNQKARLSI